MMECVGELSDLMQDLPDYCDYFLSMLIRILEEYRDTSQTSYQGDKSYINITVSHSLSVVRSDM